jgi:hypothetical protein
MSHRRVEDVNTACEDVMYNSLLPQAVVLSK